MKKKMTTAAEYREKLNRLEEQLEPANKTYFDDLRTYMSLAGILVDEGELNAQLYQMATDLAAAQADGVTAVEFFGSAPKEMADELLANTSKAGIKSLLSLAAIVVGILWAINLISDFGSKSVMRISIPQYLISGALGLLGVAGIFWLIKYGIYGKKVRSSKLVFAGIFLILLLVIGGQLAAGLLLVDDGLIRIPYPADLFLLGLLFAALTFWLIKTAEPAFYPMALVLYGFALIGIVRRLTAAGLLVGAFWEKWFALVVLTVAGGGYFLWTWLQGRKIRNG